MGLKHCNCDHKTQQSSDCQFQLELSHQLPSAPALPSHLKPGAQNYLPPTPKSKIELWVPKSTVEIPKPWQTLGNHIYHSLQRIRAFPNLWFGKPMVCVRVAFHENDGNHENDENDEGNSDSYKLGSRKGT